MIAFSDWQPDQPIFNGTAGEALNVYPGAQSYKPVASFAAYSDAPLTARCQGAASYRSSANAIGHYAGDATKLYRLVGAKTWTDSSGATYGTPADGYWSFAQFGQLAIAVNGINAPQKITIGSGTAFANLGGSPPIAKYVAIVRDFVFLGHLSTDPQTVQWSAINNAESWTIGTNQADNQALPEGGWIQGIIGGEFGLVFSENAINLFTYAGGRFIFQRNQIANGIGATIAGTIAGFTDKSFFYHETGFHMINGGSEIAPIGTERVNEYFRNNINQLYFHRVTSIIDPANNLYAVSFPDQDSGNGTPNKILFYNWITDKWSHAMMGDHELIYQAMSGKQWSLEDISAVYPDLETVPYSLDSSFWAQAGRMLMSSFNTSHHSMVANGPALAATIDTAEFQLTENRRSFVRSFRPMIEAEMADVTAAIGARNRLNEPLVWGSDIAPASNGRVNVRSNARYHRARIKIAAGATWNHARGIDEVAFTPEGMR